MFFGYNFEMFESKYKKLVVRRYTTGF